MLFLVLFIFEGSLVLLWFGQVCRLAFMNENSFANQITGRFCISVEVFFLLFFFSLVPEACRQNSKYLYEVVSEWCHYRQH